VRKKELAQRAMPFLIEVVVDLTIQRLAVIGLGSEEEKRIEQCYTPTRELLRKNFVNVFLVKVATAQFHVGLFIFTW
jgi:hypothetical protein